MAARNTIASAIDAAAAIGSLTSLRGDVRDASRAHRRIHQDDGTRRNPLDWTDLLGNVLRLPILIALGPLLYQLPCVTISTCLRIKTREEKHVQDGPRDH